MTSEVAQPAPTTLYPELDEAALRAFVAALESGDTSALEATRADEVTRARARVRFSLVKVDSTPEDDTDEPVRLDAALWVQQDTEARPLIVMPSPWTDLGWLAYAVQATVFAAKGYNVLAYTARGFGLSGGLVDVAGPLDVDDARAALDFLIARTPGGPTRIGFLGDSYGSGISQLAAAHDDRVHAVAALSTWGDLGEAFYENATRHTASVQALLGAAKNARLSEQTQRVFDDVLAGERIEETLAWAAPRSPISHVQELSGRGVPVYFSHAWHETLFPTNQTLKMFHQLTGPKRLDLSIGDHSCPEMTGIIGLPNRIWATAHRWLDHHLMDADNGIDFEGEVVGQAMWKWGQEELETRPSWEAFEGSPERQYLAGPGEGATDGRLAEKPEHGWTQEALTGIDTPATVARAIIQAGYDELTRNPKVYPTTEIDRALAAVWTAPAATDVTRLRGVPRLRLSYTASAAASSFVAYLFDMARDGTAHIITHAPFTSPDAAPGRTITADIALQATGYDVPAGHRLILVVDTHDPFYAGSNLPRAVLRFTSSEDNPSFLELPIYR
ncbi:alpha/beta fold hydrolase [Streptomyces sp. NPDC018352]|uniref:alpha/beta fold hydrolase n=1 Tax=Streptomyces sp. NPDC018352 TaxID=3157194 RepID=UPI0033C87304